MRQSGRKCHRSAACGFIRTTFQPRSCRRRVSWSCGQKGVDYRRIFTDGTCQLIPTLVLGYSSGTWVGDALVVQTNGLKDDLWADFNGNRSPAPPKLPSSLAA